MSYQIRYPCIRKMRGREGIKVRLPAMTALCFLLFLFLVRQMWPEGAACIKMMLDQLASGLLEEDSLMTALTDFFSLIPA